MQRFHRAEVLYIISDEHSMSAVITAAEQSIQMIGRALANAPTVGALKGANALIVCASDGTEIVVCRNNERIVVAATRHERGESIFDGSYSDQMHHYFVLNNRGDLINRVDPVPKNYSLIDSIVSTASVYSQVDLSALKILDSSSVLAALTEPMPYF